MLWLLGSTAVVVVAVWYLVGGSGGSGSEAVPLGPQLDMDLVETGAPIYVATCSACHGVSGEGQPNWQQQNADNTFPGPPHDSSGHTWHHPDGQLYRMVRDGGVSGAGFVSTMPAFGEILTPEQIRAVLEYIKTFWGAQERASQAQTSLRDPFP